MNKIINLVTREKKGFAIGLSLGLASAGIHWCLEKWRNKDDEEEREMQEYFDDLCKNLKIEDEYEDED